MFNRPFAQLGRGQQKASEIVQSCSGRLPPRKSTKPIFYVGFLADFSMTNAASRVSIFQLSRDWFPPFATKC